MSRLPDRDEEIKLERICIALFATFLLLLVMSFVIL